MLGPVRACPNLLRAMLLLAVPAVGANSSRAWRVLPIEDCGGNATNSSGEGVSCLEHAPSLTSSSATKAAVLAVLAFLSLVGNAWTIWSIQREGRAVARRHVGAVYALILHLSVADLLVSVCCLGGEAAWSYTVQWLAGDAACKLFKFLQMFSLYLSTFVLVLIGVDRFVVVRYPMKSLGTSGRLNKAIVFSWALSFLLSTPQIDEAHLANSDVTSNQQRPLDMWSFGNSSKWQEEKRERERKEQEEKRERERKEQEARRERERKEQEEKREHDRKKRDVDEKKARMILEARRGMEEQRLREEHRRTTGQWF